MFRATSLRVLVIVGAMAPLGCSPAEMSSGSPGVVGADAGATAADRGTAGAGGGTAGAGGRAADSGGGSFGPDGGSAVPGSNKDAGDEIIFVDGGAAAGPPPGPWVGKDIGEGAMGGGLDGRHNGWKPTGSGTGIGGVKDSFYFIHHPLKGDGEIMGRVDTSGTQVGIMIRASLEPNAPFVLLGLSEAHAEGSFLRRTAAGGMAAETKVRAAYYFKLTRKGNTFAAWGNTGDKYQAEKWQMLGTVDIAMPTGAHAGLAIAGPNTVVLRGPRITSGLPANLRHLQVYHQGEVATYENGVLTLSGWGDLFAAKEGVTFVAAPVTGAHTITAKFTSQSSTDAKAHVGLMIREGATEPMENVGGTAILSLSGDGVLELRTRPTGGGGSAIALGAMPKAGMKLPLWLRLTRDQAGPMGRVTASYSSDGKAWTTLESAMVTLTEPLLGGVFSHRGLYSIAPPESLNTAKIESVTIAPGATP